MSETAPSLTSAFSVGDKNEQVSYKEVRIPVPWGVIAGKWWGSQNTTPILVLHGWQDNCGSFDRLIPLLPKEVGYLAVDFPGHGSSSQIPEGMFYNWCDGVILIRRIKEYFKWPKCKIIGHSMGAANAFGFATFFPDLVDFIICLDGLHPVVSNHRLDMTVRSLEEFLKYDSQNSSGIEPPSYTIGEMEQILHEGTRKSIEISNCKYILERNISLSKGNQEKYYFKRDPRLKAGPILGWTKEDCYEAARRVNFPLLITLAIGTNYRSQKSTTLQSIDIIENNNKKHFELHFLPGTHHIHLNDPEKVAECLSPFILKHIKQFESINGDSITCKL